MRRRRGIWGGGQLPEGDFGNFGVWETSVTLPTARVTRNIERNKKGRKQQEEIDVWVQRSTSGDFSTPKARLVVVRSHYVAEEKGDQKGLPVWKWV